MWAVVRTRPRPDGTFRIERIVRRTVRFQTALNLSRRLRADLTQGELVAGSQYRVFNEKEI